MEVNVRIVSRTWEEKEGGGGGRWFRFPCMKNNVYIHDYDRKQEKMCALWWVCWPQCNNMPLPLLLVGVDPESEIMEIVEAYEFTESYSSAGSDVGGLIGAFEA